MPIASVDLLHGIVNGATFISQFTSQEVSPGIQAMVANAAADGVEELFGRPTTRKARPSR